MNFLFSKNRTTDADDLERYKSDDQAKGKSCAVCTASETGPVRDHNEDYLVFSFPENDPKNLIAIVADGMGGHNAGEVASKMACDLLLSYCLNNWKQYAPEILIHRAFMNAHENIAAAGKSNQQQKGMGTTASMVLIQQGKAYIGHIGDSRIYFMRGGMLQQLSRDQTLVNQMYENGQITEQEKANHPMKHVLLQALGTMPTIEPQISTEGIAVNENDRFFLCSDGVYDALREEDIKDLLLMKQSEFVLECLRSVAISRMVSDNFSAVLIDISSVVGTISSVTKEQNILP